MLQTTIIIPLDKVSEKLSILIKDTQPVGRKARLSTLFFDFFITSLAFYKILDFKVKWLSILAWHDY